MFNRTTILARIEIIKPFNHLMSVLYVTLIIILVIILTVLLRLAHMHFMMINLTICISLVAFMSVLLFHFLMRRIMMGRGILFARDFMLGFLCFIACVVMHIKMELVMM